MADEKQFQLKIISPDRTFYEGLADMIEFVTNEGEIGVYKNHAPMAVIISPGVLKIHQDGEVKKAALHGGIAEILQGEVIMLAETAEWPEEIDLNRANEAKIRAERRLKTTDSTTEGLKYEAALRRSIARIEASK